MPYELVVPDIKGRSMSEPKELIEECLGLEGADHPAAERFAA
jgi:hypothetical protein